MATLSSIITPTNIVTAESTACRQHRRQRSMGNLPSSPVPYPEGADFSAYEWDEKTTSWIEQGE